MVRFLPHEFAQLAAHHPEMDSLPVQRGQRARGTGERGQQAQVVRPVVPVEQVLGAPGVGAEEIGKRVPHRAAHPGFGLFEAPRLAAKVEGRFDAGSSWMISQLATRVLSQSKRIARGVFTGWHARRGNR